MLSLSAIATAVLGFVFKPKQTKKITITSGYPCRIIITENDPDPNMQSDRFWEDKMTWINFRSGKIFHWAVSDQKWIQDHLMNWEKEFRPSLHFLREEGGES